MTTAYILNVQELSSKAAQAKKFLTEGSLTEGFMGYIICVVRACQELTQARGLIGFSKSSASQCKRLETDVSHVADLARYCLEQATFIIKSELGGTTSSSSLNVPPPPNVLLRRESPNPKEFQSLLNQLPSVPLGGKSSYTSLPSMASITSASSTSNSAVSSASASPAASAQQPPPPQQQQQPPPPPASIMTAPKDKTNPLIRSGGFASLSSPSLPSPAGAAGSSGHLEELELVPGLQLEPHHLEWLKQCDKEEIVKLGEPARELQVTNAFLVKKNKAAIAKFEAAVAASAASGVGAPSTAVSRQRISEMHLSMMRQQTENVAISRAKQQRLIQEVVCRLQQAAHAQQQQMMPPVSPAASSQTPGEDPISKLKQVKSVLMTKFKEINDRHPAAKLAQSDLEKVMADGGDIAAIESNLKRMFATPTHPLAKKLNDYTAGFSISENRNDLGLHVSKVKGIITSVTTQSCEYLRLNPSGAGYRVAYEIATDCVVSAIHRSIWGLFLIHNSGCDDHTNQQMAQFSHSIHPACLHIKRSLWGTNSSTDIAGAEAAYKPAIDAMRSISNLEGPIEKLRAVVDSLQKTNQLADSIASLVATSEQDAHIGADDLIPVFSFVLLKSGLRNAHSESACMEQFLCEWMSPEEEGYSLATFLTCLEYVDSLSPEDIASDSIALPPILSSITPSSRQ